MHNRRDKDLGISQKITRRDFLNGVALTLGAAITPSPLFAFDEQTNPEKSAKYYPTQPTAFAMERFGIRPASPLISVKPTI